MRVTLDQVQTDGGLFTMPIEIGVYANGQAPPAISRVRVTAKSNVFTISAPSEPADVKLDPNVWVLMDARLERRR